jgi:membrane peptidoglycan carboxypeptidase
VKSCLGNSLNIPAVKVEAAVGIPYITNLEIAAGIGSYASPYLQNGGDRPAPTDWYTTLGGYPVTPLELADGAATIADLGVHHDATPVDHIVVRSTGKTMFTLNPASSARQVVPASVAFIIDEITSNDSNRVMDFGAHGDLTLGDRRVSAKTGTAEFFLDNWTVGWTPELVSTVWVGNPYNSCLITKAGTPDKALLSKAIASGHTLYSGQTINDPYSPQDLAYYGLKPQNTACGHLDNSTGITGAAPIWNADMKAALAGVKPDWYTMPKDVIQVGTGDNADFFLPGAVGSSAPCYFYGPTNTAPSSANNPAGSQCVYGGTRAPVVAPPPAPTPAPAGAPAAAPGPTQQAPPTPPVAAH